MPFSIDHSSFEIGLSACVEQGIISHFHSTTWNNITCSLGVVSSNLKMQHLSSSKFKVGAEYD